MPYKQATFSKTENCPNKNASCVDETGCLVKVVCATVTERVTKYIVLDCNFIFPRAKLYLQRWSPFLCTLED